MKKVIITVICTFILLTVNVFSLDVSASNLEVRNNTVTYTSKFTIDFNIEDLTYYPFIYSSDLSRKWFVDNVIGPTNCKDGYLYVKNLKTGRIIQLVSKPVYVIRTFENGGYFIYSNSIFYVSYIDGSIEKIYSSNNRMENDILEIKDNCLYFCEGNKIVSYNIDSYLKKEFVVADKVSMIYVSNDDEIIYESDGKIHLYNSLFDDDRTIANEYDINRLFSSETVDINSLQSISTQIDTNFNSLRSQFPNGSYFTNDGTRCTHHSSGCNYNGSCGCRSEFESIQCVAYAKWASNQYANMTTWNSTVRENIEGYDINTAFDDNEDVNLYFARCAPGAYVRLTRDINNDYGFHSIFFVNRSSTSITSYECNLYGGCEVTYITRSFWQFRSFSSCSSYITTHGYSAASNAVSYNSTYHKQYCLNSNHCSAYRLEAHYSNSPGVSGVCTACGYVGNIAYTSPLD